MPGHIQKYKIQIALITVLFESANNQVKPVNK